MNELELYVDSLDPSLSNEEKVRLVQEWKKANRWNEQEVEVSEQVELEEVDLGTVKKKDGVAGADVPSEIAAPKDTDSQLENIFSELVVPEDELLKINEKSFIDSMKSFINSFILRFLLNFSATNSGNPPPMIIPSTTGNDLSLIVSKYFTLTP